MRTDLNKQIDQIQKTVTNLEFTNARQKALKSQMVDMDRRVFSSTSLVNSYEERIKALENVAIHTAGTIKELIESVNQLSKPIYTEKLDLKLDLEVKPKKRRAKRKNGKNSQSI